MRGHGRFLELAAAAIDFDLDPLESAALSAHLAGCARCRDDAAQLQADARSLRRLAEGAPSPAVRERVMAARPTRRSSWWLPLVAAAALVVAVLGGVSAGALLLVVRESAVQPRPTWTRLASPGEFPAGAGHSTVLGVTSVSGLSSYRLAAIGTGDGGGRVWLSTDGSHWALAATTGLEDARPAALASTWQGLVAVGHCIHGGDTIATAWTSIDGRTWLASDASVFRGSTSLAAVAATPGRIVVGGSGRQLGDLPIWSSVDGRTWTEARQSTPYTRANVTGIAMGGPGFVAVGYDDVGAVAWTSTDGAVWRRVDDPSFDRGRLLAVAATPGGLVAVGRDAAGARAWTSLDGTAWMPADPFGTPATWPTAVAATSYGVVAVGGPTAADDVWISPDGVGWRAVRDQTWSGPTEIDAIAGSGRTVVVAGSSGGTAAVWLGRPPASEP
jgi:hypothetical protein